MVPAFYLMKVKKTGLLVLAVLALVILSCKMLRPTFFVYAENARIAAVPAFVGEEFSIRFIHSVQKTPVVENLVINEARNGFVLLSTKYQSFGVGLPFLESEGSFRQEGDYFIFEDMNRRFSRLSLRTGVGTELTVTLAGREYRLYEQLAPGSRVDLFIAPYYQQFF